MSRRPTILVNKNTPMVLETFSGLGTVIALDTKDVIRESVKAAEILIVRSETRVDSALLEGSNVRFVGTVTIGTDHIDLDYLASKGIAFASAPGSNANSVAEYVAAALLAWSHRTESPLGGKTLGVVGVGNVGQRVARVGGFLGMNVVLNDPPLARTAGDTSYRPLDELMQADFLSLHVPLTRGGADATVHMIDERRLQKMKSGSVLINTSRGGVVDSGALLAARAAGHLSAHLLDVWENEPTIDVRLLESAMIGTPHIAGYSLDGKVNAVQMIYRALAKFLDAETTVPEEISTPGWDELSIVIPESLETMEDVVGHVVRQAYDIDEDDAMLRGMSSLPASERGRYFMNLRATYRTRREFRHWKVTVTPRHAQFGQILESLGFHVAYTSQVQSAP